MGKKKVKAEMELLLAARRSAREGDTPAALGERLMDLVSQPLAQYNAEKARDCVAAGADVNRADRDDGWTSLHWAAWRGNEAAARLLLSHGAAMRLPNNDGATARDVARERSAGVSRIFSAAAANAAAARIAAGAAHALRLPGPLKLRKEPRA